MTAAGVDTMARMLLMTWSPILAAGLTEVLKVLSRCGDGTVY
jgi:hypothetical protein